MKKIVLGVILAFVVLFGGYIWIMAIFQGGINAEITNNVQLDYDGRTVTLPWYMNIWAEKEGSISGIDENGGKYTKFFYALPAIFEDTEMRVVVSWDNGTARMYICEARGLNVDADFPTVQWK